MRVFFPCYPASFDAPTEDQKVLLCFPRCENKKLKHWRLNFEQQKMDRRTRNDYAMRVIFFPCSNEAFTEDQAVMLCSSTCEDEKLKHWRLKFKEK